MVSRNKPRSPLRFTLRAPDTLAVEAARLLAASGYLTVGVERFTDRQWQVLQAVREIQVVDGLGGPQGTASPGSGVVCIDAGAIRRNGMGGLIWLLCHEAYHLWDPELGSSTHVRSEGNANLYANRVRALLEKEPVIYRWGSTGSSSS